MGVMEARRRLLMQPTQIPASDILHYATRVKTVIPGGNGTKTHIDFDLNAYYSIMAGNYYLQDTSDIYSNIVNGEIQIYNGLSINYGPAFPVELEPNTTYEIHGQFNNCVIGGRWWDENGNIITGSIDNLTDGSRFSVPSYLTNVRYATLVFHMIERYVDCTASNITITKV